MMVSYFTPPGVVLVWPLAVGGALVYSTTLLVLAVAAARAGAAISPWAWAGSSSGALRGTGAPGGAIGIMSGGASHPISNHPINPAVRTRVHLPATPLRFDFIRHSPY